MYVKFLKTHYFRLSRSAGYLFATEFHSTVTKPKVITVNFAVPDINVLREFHPYVVETKRKPGIFDDTISEMSVSLTNKSACITFDGKK